MGGCCLSCSDGFDKTCSFPNSILETIFTYEVYFWEKAKKNYEENKYFFYITQKKKLRIKYT